MITVHNNSRGRSRGFSLAEILVAIAIFAVIFIGALALYDSANKVFKKGVEDADVQQSTRVGFDKLVSDVRMAGFDYDRDGIPINAPDLTWSAAVTIQPNWYVIPTTPNGHLYRAIALTGTSKTGATEPTWPATAGAQVVDGGVTWEEVAGIYRFQQADEQIEYIAKSALTIRGNFDFSSAVGTCPKPEGCDSGREPAYESNAFPAVTTGNDEIVTYALVSDDASKNTDTISFYADVKKPRNVFPGGAAETEVKIDKVDLSNANPPYTLFRITLDDLGKPVRSPVATNMRSMEFTYYTDVTGGSKIVTVGTATVDETKKDLGIGGKGAYNPADPTAAASVDLRALRAGILGVKIALVGMNPNIDKSYVDTVETTTGALFKNTRKYRLETLIVPRNIGMSGLRELDVNPPGQPTIKTACAGYCGIVKVSWDPAPATPEEGTADDFEILYDTSAAGTFTRTQLVGGGNFGYVTGLDPSLTYYFKVRARNVFGTSTSAQSIGAPAKNTTTPETPGNLSATKGTTAVANQITLTWDVPVNNVSGQDQITCIPPPGPNGGSSSSGPVGQGEIRGYRVYRSTDPAFASYTMIADENLSGGWTPYVSGASATWSDTSVGNCVKYYYKIAAVEFCGERAEYNVSPAKGLSAMTSTAVEGEAKSTTAPMAPADLSLTSAACTGTPPNQQCPITLSWPKVTMDALSRPVVIDTYVVKRVRTLSGSPSVEAAGSGWVNCDTIPGISGGTPGLCQRVSGLAQPNAPPVATATHNVAKTNGAGTSYRYEYQVAATHCNLVSAFSPPAPKIFPCDLGGIAAHTVTINAPAAYDGDGRSTPWLVESPGSGVLNVTYDQVPVTAIQSITGSAYIGSALDSVLVKTASTATSATFTLPSSGGEGTIYTLVITITDANGCSETYVRFVQDSPSSCCLVPASFDATVVNFVPGNTFVDVTLKNLCDEPLVIQASGLSLVWTPGSTPSGTALTSVTFPAGLDTTSLSAGPSNTNGTPAGYTVPANALAVIPAAKTETWAVGKVIPLGTIVAPTSGLGRRYVAVKAGTTSLTTEPAWPQVAGATVDDASVKWREFSSYTIRLNFDKAIVTATSPLQKLCAKSTQGAATATFCNAVKGSPNKNPGACD
jgi:prepilin-type N-terminal cleavage/methylation domain-containing protein